MIIGETIEDNLIDFLDYILFLFYSCYLTYSYLFNFHIITILNYTCDTFEKYFALRYAEISLHRYD